MLNDESLDGFLPKTVNYVRVCVFMTSLQHCMGDPSQYTKQEKEIKLIQSGKGEIKYSYSHIILYK